MTKGENNNHAVDSSKADKSFSVDSTHDQRTRHDTATSVTNDAASQKKGRYDGTITEPIRPRDSAPTPANSNHSIPPQFGRYDGTIMDPIGPPVQPNNKPITDDGNNKTPSTPDKQLANGCPDSTVESSSTLRTVEKPNTGNPAAVQSPIYQDPTTESIVHDAYGIREQLFRKRMMEKADREGIGNKADDRVEEDYAEEIVRTPSVFAAPATQQSSTTGGDMPRDLQEMYAKLVDLEAQKAQYIKSQSTTWTFGSYNPIDHYNEMISDLLYRIYLFETQGAEAVNQYDDDQKRGVLYTFIRQTVDNGGATAMAIALTSLTPLEGPSGLARPAIGPEKPTGTGSGASVAAPETKTAASGDVNLVKYEIETPTGTTSTSAEVVEGAGPKEGIQPGCGKRELVEVNASNKPTGPSDKTPPKKGGANTNSSSNDSSYQSRFAQIKKQISYNGPTHTTDQKGFQGMQKSKTFQPGDGFAGNAEFTFDGQEPLARGDGDVVSRVKPGSAVLPGEQPPKGQEYVQFVTETNGLVTNYFDSTGTQKSYIPARLLQWFNPKVKGWVNVLDD